MQQGLELRPDGFGIAFKGKSIPDPEPYLKDEKTLKRNGPIPLYYKSLYGL